MKNKDKYDPLIIDWMTMRNCVMSRKNKVHLYFTDLWDNDNNIGLTQKELIVSDLRNSGFLSFFD